MKLDSIHNLSHIIKVAGTLSVKGEPTADRPHRLSRSLDAFERREDPLLARVLRAMPIAASVPATASKPARPATSASAAPGSFPVANGWTRRPSTPAAQPRVRSELGIRAPAFEYLEHGSYLSM